MNNSHFVAFQCVYIRNNVSTTKMNTFVSAIIGTNEYLRCVIYRDNQTRAFENSMSNSVQYL